MLRTSSAGSDDLESVVLHFFIDSNGELRCRATDIPSRRTWIVPSARQIHDLLSAASRA